MLAFFLQKIAQALQTELQGNMVGIVWDLILFCQTLLVDNITEQDEIVTINNISEFSHKRVFSCSIFKVNPIAFLANIVFMQNLHVMAKVAKLKISYGRDYRFAVMLF